MQRRCSPWRRLRATKQSGPFVHYTHSGDCWGLKQRITDPMTNAPKYRAVMEWVATHRGDAQCPSLDQPTRARSREQSAIVGMHTQREQDVNAPPEAVPQLPAPAPRGFSRANWRKNGVKCGVRITRVSA